MPDTGPPRGLRRPHKASPDTGRIRYTPRNSCATSPKRLSIGGLNGPFWGDLAGAVEAGESVCEGDGGGLVVGFVGRLITGTPAAVRRPGGRPAPLAEISRLSPRCTSRAACVRDQAGVGDGRVVLALGAGTAPLPRSGRAAPTCRTTPHCRSRTADNAGLGADPTAGTWPLAPPPPPPEETRPTASSGTPRSQVHCHEITVNREECQLSKAVLTAAANATGSRRRIVTAEAVYILFPDAATNPPTSQFVEMVSRRRFPPIRSRPGRVLVSGSCRCCRLWAAADPAVLGLVTMADVR